MTPLYPEILSILLNGILIAVALSFPFLLGLILLSILRRSLKADRAAFEQEILGQLKLLQETQARILERLSS